MPTGVSGNGGARYTEKIIEEHFGISVSKLRTAQRVKYVRSDVSLNEERRIIRVWDIISIGRVYMANALSTYLNVPFLSAIQIITTYEKHRCIDIGKGLLDESYVGIYQHGYVRLYDRHLVTATDASPDAEFVLGKLETDDSGRTYFVENLGLAVPSPDEWISCSIYNGLKARERFRKILEDLA